MEKTLTTEALTGEIFDAYLRHMRMVQATLTDMIDNYVDEEQRNDYKGLTDKFDDILNHLTAEREHNVETTVIDSELDRIFAEH